MNDTFIPKIWSEELMKSMKNGLTMLVPIRKSEFIEDVKEYKSLPNRRWKRKRDLERRIAFNARYWIEDIEKIREKDSTLTIPRINNLTK